MRQYTADAVARYQADKRPQIVSAQGIMIANTARQC
jgi:hypothetical protein